MQEVTPHGPCLYLESLHRLSLKVQLQKRHGIFHSLKPKTLMFAKHPTCYPQDLDAPLRLAAQRKVNSYRQQYADNQNSSFLPAIT